MDPLAERVAAVAIGRNEGERLVRCLASLRGQAGRLVYVDSGSTDGSVAAARAAGAQVVALDRATPFTAARARNAGVAALAAAGPLPPYVQFVDGDCELDPGWVSAAVAFLDATPGAAVACGRRRERHPGATLWNRLVDMEWNTSVGEARACGGDSLMRSAALAAVGGFDGRLIAGEEPELCFRLRRAGWTVWRLDHEMTRHDAAMTRMGQWWRRAVRGGWAYAEGAVLHGASLEGYNRRAVRSILVWGTGLPLALLGPPVAAAFGAPLAVLALPPLALLGAGAMAVRIARGRQVRHGDPWADALLYGAFTMLGKLPQLAGVARFWTGRWLGREARLIEYKNPAAPAAEQGGAP
jgi:hypothetical protein